MSRTYTPAISEEQYNAALNALSPLQDIVDRYELGEDPIPTLSVYQEAIERIEALDEVLQQYERENAPLQDFSDGDEYFGFE